MAEKHYLYSMKKGDPADLKGVLVVYAFVRSPDSPENRKNPVHEMAKNGILAASGDYRTQHSLNDFLKKELGLTLDDLKDSEHLGAITGLPDGANPDLIRRKLESLKGFEEMIPTPSKLEAFDSEDELLQRDCDIYFVGEFDRMANANLAVNALPILYQALYREQAAGRITQEIDRMLSGISPDTGPGHYTDNLADVEHRLNSEFIPEIIYNRDNAVELALWDRKLRNYLSGYKYPAEVDKLVRVASTSKSENREIQVLLELYVKKITSFLLEDYKKVAELKKMIEEKEAALFLE